jgi:hypothetical protein
VSRAGAIGMSSDEGFARVSCGLRGFFMLAGCRGLLNTLRWKDAHWAGREWRKLP